MINFGRDSRSKKGQIYDFNGLKSGRGWKGLKRACIATALDAYECSYSSSHIELSWEMNSMGLQAQFLVLAVNATTAAAMQRIRILGFYFCQNAYVV